MEQGINYAKKANSNLKNDEELKIILENTAKNQIEKGINYFKKGILDSSKTSFQTALKANPKNADAFYNLAIIAKQNQDTLLAIKYIDSSIFIKDKYEYKLLKNKLMFKK